MRNLVLGMLLGLVISVPIAYTQQKETLTFGTGASLQIDMSEVTARHQLAAFGLVLSGSTDATGGHYVVAERDNLRRGHGFAEFDNAGLSYASYARVETTDLEAVRMVRDFLTLARDFEARGLTSCTFETRAVGNPGSADSQSASVRCGKRTAQLLLTGSQGQTWASVEEVIRR
jgi:hypothetical protein